METARFNIRATYSPFLQFESEVHISAEEDENNTIIIRSGYADLEPTLELAVNILTILNHGNSPK